MSELDETVGSRTRSEIESIIRSAFPGAGEISWRDSNADLVVTFRQLAAHPRWEWRDGVRPRDESPYTRITPQVAHKLAGTVARMGIGVVPDLSDDATAGIVLGMVREWAHARGFAVEVFCGTQQSTVEAGPVGGYGRTLGEAAGRCLLSCWAVDAADGDAR